MALPIPPFGGSRAFARDFGFGSVFPSIKELAPYVGFATRSLPLTRAGHDIVADANINEQSAFGMSNSPARLKSSVRVLRATGVPILPNYRSNRYSGKQSQHLATTKHAINEGAYWVRSNTGTGAVTKHSPQLEAIVCLRKMRLLLFAVARRVPWRWLVVAQSDSAGRRPCPGKPLDSSGHLLATFAEY